MCLWFVPTPSKPQTPVPLQGMLIVHFCLPSSELRAKFIFPIIDLSVKATVRDAVARVEVSQRFKNTESTPIEATYVHARRRSFSFMSFLFPQASLSTVDLSSSRASHAL